MNGNMYYFNSLFYRELIFQIKDSQTIRLYLSADTVKKNSHLHIKPFMD